MTTPTAWLEPQGQQSPSKGKNMTTPIPKEKPTVAKAVVAGVTALAAALATALSDSSLTSMELVSVVAGTIVAVASVWAVSNDPA